MTLYRCISMHAEERPGNVALEWPGGQISYAALLQQIDEATQLLSEQDARVLAVDLKNGPDLVVLDIAMMQSGICSIPLPRFFSGSQLVHVLNASGADAVLTDDPTRLRRRTGGLLDGTEIPLNIAGRTVYWVTNRPAAASTTELIPDTVLKITFTSGTTGDPKGVMMSWAQIRPVVQSLADAVGMTTRDRHLVLMPLAILLENIAGVYAPLWAGATVILRPVSQLGLQGSTAVDGRTMLNALSQAGATTAIFTPQTLQETVEALENRPDTPLHLRFAAVGGAPVSPRLIDRATDAGLPVFEGYGLSECASVVCLNTPQANRQGSVGQPLPHVRLQIAADGEVVVADQSFIGYLGCASENRAGWRTGDLGELDGDGYLYLHGRRRNVFITAFGRNVAPEWVERELTLERAIVQAAVFGESRPYNVAILVTNAATMPEEIEIAVARTNQTLPDYARITRWILADEPFSPTNGELTGTGRVRRQALFARYADRIESLYNEAQTL